MGVTPGSPCHGKVSQGDTLETINGKPIDDVLDYRFYSTERKLKLCLRDADGQQYNVKIKKDEYDDLGLEFSTFLMDEHRHCRNKCVFCFIDQMPKGMRKSLYFKDDDSRLSFLFGNYITLTNLTQRDIDRIVEMHISPINISVHTTNPELRVRMMSNPSAGESLNAMKVFADGGIKMNTQLVLVPGWNDGEELKKTLHDLGRLYPAVQSIALVPVGLTAHRQGLPDLQLFTAEQAKSTIEIADEFNRMFELEHSEHIAYAADELYLTAGIDLPGCEYYNEFPQLDNGIGLCALLESDFFSALDSYKDKAETKYVSIATGKAAYPLMKRLASACEEKTGVHIEAFCINNVFFGETVTVSGLITGRDLINQLADKPLGERLLISASMLRDSDDEVFLDDVTLAEVSGKLGVPVVPVLNDADELLYAITRNSEE